MRTSITSADVHPAAGAYSHGVDAGGLVFVSGQAPLDEQGRVVGDDFGAQARAAFANLEKVLGAAGLGLGDVQRVGVFLADLADFAELNVVMGELFEAPYPARTTVPVALPGFLLEVDAIAVRSTSR